MLCSVVWTEYGGLQVQRGPGASGAMLRVRDHAGIRLSAAGGANRWAQAASSARCGDPCTRRAR